MDLARPLALLLLSLVPAWIWLARRHRARRSSDWAALGQPGRPAPARPWWVAFTLLVAALSGPRIGLAPASDTSPGHDVILLVDASKSMRAEDAVPDRLGAAVDAAEGLIAELGREAGGRVGVVAFAGNAEPRCPLTENLGAAIDALRALKPGDVRPGGTDLGAALLVAIESFDDQEGTDGRTVVVLTDGEDHPGTWPGVLDRLRASRVIVHGVTFGDPQGAKVPGDKEADVLRFQGREVVSRRTDAALKAVADATGGVLVPAGRSRVDLGALYRSAIAPSERRSRAMTRPPERADRYAWPLAAALGWMASASWPRSRRWGPMAALLVAGLGAAPGWTRADRAVGDGRSAFARGDYPGAWGAFEAAVRLAPDSPIARYDAAAALFRLGRFEEAETFYNEARRRSADPNLRAKIDYARGNTATARGRFKEALGHYDACLAAAGADGAILRDARINRAFAVARMPPPSSPDPEGDGRTKDRPPADRGDDPKGDPGPDPSAPGDPGASPPGSPPKGGASRSPSPSGDGASEGGARSPQADLDAMLADVRKAQASRGDDPPPAAASARGDRKDW